MEHVDEISAMVAGSLPKAFRATEVPLSDELQRIAVLPTRVPTLPGPDECLEFSRMAARNPQNVTFTLRPVQVWALREMATARGLFGIIPVGEGKTAITFLAPALLGARRPLLLIPASLREKTLSDFAELHRHVIGPRPEAYRVETYQKAATENAADFLTQYRPDLVVADEGQNLFNTKSAVLRRLRRYLHATPGCRFVVLTGTITKRSLLDYAHLLGMALREGSPVPRSWPDAQPWASAIDDKPAMGRRVKPGALPLIAVTPLDGARLRAAVGPDAQVKTAREVYQRRLVFTPGVVAIQPTHTGALALSCADAESLGIVARDNLSGVWASLRDSWELPTGEEIIDSLEMARAARSLALGFFYRWRVKPPEPWREARREWARYVRAVLKHSRTMDTEAQVISALEGKNGHLAHATDGRAILHAWRAVKGTFTPESVPEWVSTEALEFCAEWVHRARGSIVWVDHTAFGERLAQRARVSYFGEQGCDARGMRIEKASPGAPLVASIPSSGTGRNLQAWSRSLVTAPPFTGPRLEQLIGRTHRTAQREPVEVCTFLGCFEHSRTFWRAVADCRYQEQTTGIRQRVSVATSIDVPEPEELLLGNRNDPRWSPSGRLTD